MKVKKQKRHRKVVRFYTVCFGFREPFKILCDGTFIHHLLTNQITSAGHALSKSLGGPTKLFTTRCVIGELKSLGASYSESFAAARSLITARCDHEKRKSAAQCIEEVIGEDNSEHFFLATQDTDLRRKFQEGAVVPVVYGLKNSLFLEPPSEYQRQLASKMEAQRLHASDTEMKVLERKLATETKADSPGVHEGLEDQLAIAQALAKRNSARRNLGVGLPKFKRNRPKAPNPLSCKKKQKRVIPSSASKQDTKNDGGNNDGGASGKRIRKRKRSRNKKPGETNGQDVS